MRAGHCISHDSDLGPGWHHLAAVRGRDRLQLYVDGRLVADSVSATAGGMRLPEAAPLLIGAGATDTFCGRLGYVALHKSYLSG